MRPVEKTGPESPDSPDFDPRSTAIFDKNFEFYGTLDASGHVLNLKGRLFDRANTKTKLLRGQLF